MACPRQSLRTRHCRPCQPHFQEPAMRPFASSIVASAMFAATALCCLPAAAQPTLDLPACAPLTVAAPVKLIESCSLVIDNPAASEADRLDAMITRAAALHANGQTTRALAEID